MSRNRSATRKIWATALVVLIAVGGATLLVATSRVASATPTCNLTVNSENLGNNAVQSAINSANPGWRVCVGAGSFPEQLSISTSGITLAGAGVGLTIINPASVNTTTVDWDSNAPQAPLAAVILVDNTTGVTISDLTVNGSAAASSIGGCGTDFVGVDFQNSSGSLLRAAVTGIQLAPSLLGCQNQFAVYAYTGWFTTGYVPLSPLQVTVARTSVTVYGKNGITCDDPGLRCILTLDTTVGIGGTSATAQNGIQIAYGAVGHLQSNKVSADNYTGAGSTLDWFGTGFQATGILLYNPGTGTTVAHSTVTKCPTAIAEFETTATSVHITGNTITAAEGYGIVVNGAPGTTAYIANNTINAAATGAPGILVDNGTFNISHNLITHVRSSGTNGASQVVCGTGSYLVCATTLTIPTAAVQAVSEGNGGPTNVTLWSNTFHLDSLSLATLAMPTGAVTVQWV
ncbi:MAG: right-handed parallel beta-helix repeat-containing protein [Thermoplasmata archaeon]|nr:right-handed parallel beta-helix repeat-containing protein [Thermoplasmata archaeon]